MINITVKTLDSQNHNFTVDSDFTVGQFKAHIADKVNIAADTQRIIYCGRVLQDGSKLSDYDVDGKVVHLVQRAPPSANSQRSSQSSTSSSSPFRRIFRGADHGNTMLLGSVAFPSNIMDSQGIVTPPPTHTLAGSRLNVAKRMLLRAEQIISFLENPNNETEPPDDSQDEVTPVIEARVIVPSNGEPIDEAFVLSAVQNSIMNRGAQRTTVNGSTETRPSTSEASSSSASVNTPADSSTTEDTASTSTESPSGSGLPEYASGTAEMAELLRKLSDIQRRFAPFMERYQTFMQNDPEVPPDQVPIIQPILNRISQILHYLGHAYHSLSDIIIRTRTPRPRPLLCRPILIQHSAVLQAGIPIQVEAQFSLSNERPSSSTTTTTTSTQPTTTTESLPRNSAPTPAEPQSNPPENPQAAANNIFLPLQPFLNTVRVQSFPMEIRIPQNSSNSSQNNNNNASSASNQEPAESTTAAPPTSSARTNPLPSGSDGFNNPNLEFIMEVTPEVLRGVNGQPPDLLQSIMQVAGQLINGRSSTTQPNTSVSEGAQSTSSGTSAQASSGQNSQARGNTQTNPTTSTSTRSTPRNFANSRPHVHLHQQAMQGGFDPFLPCNSHHISRPRERPSTQQQTATPTTNNSTGSNNSRPHPDAQAGIFNIVNEAINIMRRFDTSSFPNRNEGEASAESGGNATASDRIPSAPPMESFNANNAFTFSDILRQTPTIADLLQQLPLHNLYTEGESILSDLLMLLCRNLTLRDVVSIDGVVIGEEIQNFFVSRILDNSTGPEAINLGVDRLLEEMQPFLNNFREMPTRQNIDMVASATSLLRTRLPNIINSICHLSENPSNFRQLVDSVLQTVKELCALAAHVCTIGDAGVRRVFDLILTRLMQDVPNDLQQFTLMTTRVRFCRFLSNINIPSDSINQFIVYTNANTAPTVGVENKEDKKVNSSNLESMEVDQEASGSGSESGNSPSLKLEDTIDTMPNLVIGSEPWHNQVPVEWVPIIAKDTQNQRKQPNQTAFSDAYLAGMPSKRRKIVHSSKMHGSVSHIITESVKRAVTATGLTSAAPLETVAQAAGACEEIQTAYRNLLKSTVQPSLKDNESFTPERFPNASNFFSNTQ